MVRGRGPLSSSSISLVVIIRELDPAWIRTSARRVRVRAVHTNPRTWIYVELAVDHDSVAGVDGDAGSQGGVVVYLQAVARSRLDLEALVTSRFNRVRKHCRVESDLGAAGAVDDVLVKALVVGGFATATSRDGDHNGGERTHCQGGPHESHSRRACSSDSLPS